MKSAYLAAIVPISPSLELKQISFGKLAEIIAKPVLIYALEKLNAASADLKFNAYFHGLLYDFMLEVAEENKTLAGAEK